MPQFDFNILNNQNINIFSFSISYLFYIKSIYFLFLYTFKSPCKLLSNVITYFLKEFLYIFMYIGTFFTLLLPLLIKVRLFISVLLFENKHILLT